MDGENHNERWENNIKNVIEIPLEDVSQDVVFEIRATNNENPLINVKENEDISINLTVGGNRTRQYIVWAYLDSVQVKISGDLFKNIEISENMLGSTNLNLKNTMQPGVYELEVFCVPSPYDGVNDTLRNVISAKRYTVKVE